MYLDGCSLRPWAACALSTQFFVYNDTWPADTISCNVWGKRCNRLQDSTVKALRPTCATENALRSALRSLCRCRPRQRHHCYMACSPQHPRAPSQPPPWRCGCRSSVQPPLQQDALRTRPQWLCTAWRQAPLRSCARLALPLQHLAPPTPTALGLSSGLCCEQLRLTQRCFLAQGGTWLCTVAL